MKKTFTVLMMVLLSAMLIISCKSDPKNGGSSGDGGSSAKPKIINITYDVNGGELEFEDCNPSSATEGDSINLVAPTRETESLTGVEYSINDSLYCTSADVVNNYTFKGWKVEGADDSTASDYFTAGSEDVKLVAVWDVTSTGSNYSGIKLKDTVTVGTVIELGNYNESENDIKWTVLNVDKTNKKALLFSTECIVQAMQNSTSSTSYFWGNGSPSPIYQWLNNTGSSGFVSQCKLGNVSMLDYSAGKVFLLSKDEFNTYVKNSSAKTCRVYWWLRTAGSGTGQCLKVYPSGDILDGKLASSTSGVRPAFWISL